MIDYRLDDLGWYEFEQLAQSLLKARLGLGIEAWGGYGDWGRDAYFNGALRYPTCELTAGPFVFQCKFVEGANAAGPKARKPLLDAIRKECESIRRNLKPTGNWSEPPQSYVLFTNAPVSPKLRQDVEDLLRSVLPTCTVTVLGGQDVCQWLRLSPEVVRSFPQLLSLRDLQELLREVVNAETLVRSENAISFARSYSRVFVPTQAYYAAREKLHQLSFVVLEGPPEMGKTTIGRILALSQVLLGWEAIECRNPAEVLRSFRRDGQQVFVADDFFGRTEYEPTRVSEWQSELAHILPLLGSSHWLVLTCRAHLLEMAKANLDIAGQNDRFPDKGEVVVDAGNLKQGEKARILYRHAKAAGLSQHAKTLVKIYAPEIVKDVHFTPERIRRLVEELIPALANQQNLPKPKVQIRIAEALSNPTNQMRVSFRRLTAPHRWLLYALLESDLFSAGGRSLRRLRERYEALCPTGLHQPFERVLDELTEAFIRKSPGLFEQGVDWIHPNCRDLAIVELSEHIEDRKRFLTNCSEVGLALACSVGGGAAGNRQLPLLQTTMDWRCFGYRAKQLLSQQPRLLRIVWNNLKSLVQKAKEEPGLNGEVQRLRELIVNHLLPVAVRTLGQRGYSDTESLKTYFDLCSEISLQPSIKLEAAWTDCLEDAVHWADDQWVISQDDQTPGNILAFLKVLHDCQPDALQDSQVRARLNEIAGRLIDRGESEDSSNYDSPKDDDEASEMADAFESVGKAFHGLGQLPIFEENTRKSFEQLSAHFKYRATSLRAAFIQEPDYDEESHSSWGSEDLDIGELFRDL